MKRPSRTRLPYIVCVLLLVAALSAPSLAYVQPGLASSFPGIPEEATGFPPGGDSASHPHVPGVVLVGLKPGGELGSVLAFSEKLAAKQGLDLASEALTAEPLFPFSQINALEAGEIASPLARTYRLRLPKGLDVVETAESLAADPAVAYAEPDYLALPALVPNDPRLGLQWGLEKVGAAQAWDHSTGSAQTVIAIVDSGLDLAHQDLASKVWANPGEIAGNGFDDDNNGRIDDVHGWNFLGNNSDLSDDYGHGTQVAGVAAAATNNGLGIAGMCWSCRIMTVKVMQSSGVVNYSDLALGVAYAAANGAHVINLSLGGYADSITLRTAIESASTTAVVIAGAGNDSRSTPFYPAAYPQVLAVGSTDPADLRASFSNYGDWVEMASPGVNIQTTYAGNNGYGVENGSSFSAPLVAGAAGLLISKNPGWSPALVRQQLVNTGAALPGLSIGTRLNAGAALSQPPQAKLELTAWSVNGQNGGRPDRGVPFDLVLTLRNTWLPARGLTAVLQESDPYITLLDSQGAFGDINTGDSAANSGDVFRITLASNTPYGYMLPFTLKLTGADGYSLSLPFTLQVRSGIEQIPNGTVYDENTTWTNDKTYILAGSAAVASGATLTIQPGTLVKVNPGYFLRIEGSLVADAAGGEPITFTTNSTTGQKWTGLRFTDTAQAAVFDSEGNYVSGSILRNVRIQSAETGVSLLSRAPYLTSLLVSGNYTGIKSGSSSAVIDNSTFVENGVAIQVDGGNPVIRGSTFDKNSSGISGSGSSPAILHNTFTNQLDQAISLQYGYQADIRYNRFLNNGQAVNVLSYAMGKIENNLMAHNYGGITFDINQSSYNLTQPVLAYNPTNDEYLVAWYEDVLGVGHVYTLILNGEGQSVSGINQIAPTGYAIDSIPAAIYNPIQKEFLLAFRSPEGIKAQRLDQHGKAIGTPALLDSIQQIQKFHIVHRSSDNTYLIVWVEPLAPGNFKGRVLTATGIPAGSIFQIGSDVGSAFVISASLAYDPLTHRSLALMRASSCGTCLFGAWITNAQDGPSIVLNGSADSQIIGHPLVFINDGENSRYMGLWRNRIDLPFHLEGQAWSQAGEVLSGPTEVYTSTRFLGDYPALAYGAGANQLLAASIEFSDGAYNGSVVAQRLGTNGAPNGQPIALTTQQSAPKEFAPVVVFNTYRQEYLAAWIDNQEGKRSIYGQRIGLDGSLLDNPWSVQNESLPGVNFSITPRPSVKNNTIFENQTSALTIGGWGAGVLEASGNNWFGNATYDVIMTAPRTITVTLGANYWGGIPTSQIAARIYDCNDTPDGCGSTTSTIGRIVRQGLLSEPAQTAPAFIQSYSVNPNPLGIERGTFDVTFSRPMLTTTSPDLTFFDARRGTEGPVPEINFLPHSIAQDALGRVWISSTWNGNQGAWRYDGQTWTQYLTNNSGLHSNNVNIVYAAPDNSIWFVHNDLWLSRWNGNSWSTIGPEGMSMGGPIIGIAVDSQNRPWISSNFDVLRFENGTWISVDVSSFLMPSMIQRLTSDSKGQIWVQFANGLARWSGSGWTIYSSGEAFPSAHAPASVFIDDQDRIWVSLNPMPEAPLRFYVAMFNGTHWELYNAENTGGVLTQNIMTFGQYSDGRIIAVTHGPAFTYYEGVWSKVENTFYYPYPFLLDKHNNVWMSDVMMTRFYVRWAGLVYPVVDNGAWLSDRVYRATFDVIPTIPQGEYRLTVEGAVGTDSMTSAPTAPGTFEVAYAGYVSDETPPSRPVVIALNDGSLTRLSVSWTSSDPQGIAQYRYALGTTPGGRDVMDWRYVSGTTTSINLSGLLLTSGKTYYASVSAQNKSGLWSQVGVSNPVVAGQVTVLQRQLYLPLLTK